MAYKNSAGVKFNDATELIIRADPDGTVESCYNKSNNTEYVGGGNADYTTCNVTINKENAEGGITVLSCHLDVFFIPEETTMLMPKVNLTDDITTFEAVMYQGKGFVLVISNDPNDVISGTGNIISEEDGGFFFDGDITITIAQ